MLCGPPGLLRFKPELMLEIGDKKNDLIDFFSM